MWFYNKFYVLLEVEREIAIENRIYYLVGFLSSVYFKCVADTKLTSAFLFNLHYSTQYVGVKDREMTCNDPESSQ